MPHLRRLHGGGGGGGGARWAALSSTWLSFSGWWPPVRSNSFAFLPQSGLFCLTRNGPIGSALSKTPNVCGTLLYTSVARFPVWLATLAAAITAVNSACVICSFCGGCGTRRVRPAGMTVSCGMSGARRSVGSALDGRVAGDGHGRPFLRLRVAGDARAGNGLSCTAASPTAGKTGSSASWRCLRVPAALPSACGGQGQSDRPFDMQPTDLPSVKHVVCRCQAGLFCHRRHLARPRAC